ncbi:MAG TPA: ParM/StbA family protein [Aggregatilineaceae bacterium]|nr:ParM/StbA family protein [Aggregatilineaceae bacterium]
MPKGKKRMTIKPELNLAIDAGNGTTCIVSEQGQALVFPSVIQQVEDIRLDGRGSQGFTIHISRQNAETGDYQDRKSFAVGETANLLPGLKTRITDKSRIGSEYQLTLILAGTVKALDALIDNDATEIKASVIWWLNVPPIYYGFAGKLYDLAGCYQVEYNRRTYTLNAKIGHVYPEGAGAAAVYMLDESGHFANPQFATGRTGIVDGGYRTVDSAIFEGPVLLENSAQSLTNSISGVYHLMQQWAMQEFGEDWTEQECEAHLRNGYAVLRESKERVDLADWIDDLGSRLADLIEADIFQKQWNGLGDVDRVILAGGVSYMVAQHLKERYPAVIHLREEYPHTQNVPYELMNAEGHMRLLKAELQRQS